MGAETCTSHRRVGLNGVALVEETFLVELFEQIPEGFDVLVVVSDVRVLEINPVAHLLGEVRPLTGVFHHLLTAGSVVLIDADLLADVLFGDAEFLFYAEFNRQSVGIPSGFALHLIALHGFVAAEGVFDCTCQNVVNARHAVCRRRTFEEEERLVPFTHSDTFVEQIFLFPLLQHLAADSSQI